MSYVYKIPKKNKQIELFTLKNLVMNNVELRKELRKMIICRLRDAGLLNRQDYFQKVNENPYGTIESMEDSTV